MIKFYEWRDEYAIGIEEIDVQHMNLFAIVKMLYQIMESKQSTESVEKNFLNTLIDYTKTHFADEEAFMEAHGVSPEYFEEHVKEHKELIKQVGEFQSDLEAEHHVFAPKMAAFLVDWLKNHIANTDHKIPENIKSGKESDNADTDEAPA